MEKKLRTASICVQGGYQPKTGEPTRVAIKKNDDGKKVRVAKKSGEEIK